jgi:hypothetical protein
MTLRTLPTSRRQRERLRENQIAKLEKI